jgi:hypothetical protein
MVLLLWTYAYGPGHFHWIWAAYILILGTTIVVTTVNNVNKKNISIFQVPEMIFYEQSDENKL